MAECDQGYPCQVCRGDVASIVDSDLYLRFVIGELDPEVLHTAPERHLRCNPVLTQFIEDDRFDAVIVDGPMSRDQLDDEFVQERVRLVSAGYRRLLQIAARDGDRDVTGYPLAEIIDRYRS